MLGWFQALMPKEERFFELFAQHATIVVAGAEALRGVLKGGDEVEHYCRIVSELEEEADEITREVLHRGAPHLHHPVRPRRHPGPDHLDGRRHRPDAQDRQGHHAVRGAQLRAADAGRWATSSCRRRAGLRRPCRCCARSARNAGRSARSPSRSPGSRSEADDLHDVGLQGAVPSQCAAQRRWTFIIGAEIYDHLEKVVDRFEDVANEMQRHRDRSRLTGGQTMDAVASACRC